MCARLGGSLSRVSSLGLLPVKMSGLDGIGKCCVDFILPISKTCYLASEGHRSLKDCCPPAFSTSALFCANAGPPHTHIATLDLLKGGTFTCHAHARTAHHRARTTASTLSPTTRIATQAQSSLTTHGNIMEHDRRFHLAQPTHHGENHGGSQRGRGQSHGGEAKRSRASHFQG